MALGITDHVWSVSELIDAALKAVPTKPTPTPTQRRRQFRVIQGDLFDMPLTGPIPEGHSFFCPHCGALYAVTHSRLSKRDSNVAKCVVCSKIMDQWESTDVRIFKLVHRPEDA